MWFNLTAVAWANLTNFKWSVELVRAIYSGWVFFRNTCSLASGRGFARLISIISLCLGASFCPCWCEGGGEQADASLVKPMKPIQLRWLSCVSPSLSPLSFCTGFIAANVQAASRDSPDVTCSASLNMPAKKKNEAIQWKVKVKWFCQRPSEMLYQ